MSTFLLMQADAAGAAAQLCVWGSSRKSVHDLQLHSSWGEEVLWSWGSHWLVAGSGWAWTLLPSPCIVSGRVLNWMCASVGTTRICHTVLPILCECDIRLLFLMPCSCVRYYQHNLCLAYFTVTGDVLPQYNIRRLQLAGHYWYRSPNPTERGSTQEENSQL